MNATGKQMIAFWLHKKGEQWSLKSVDKDSNPEVNPQKYISERSAISNLKIEIHSLLKEQQLITTHEFSISRLRYLYKYRFEFFSATRLITLA